MIEEVIWYRLIWANLEMAFVVLYHWNDDLDYWFVMMEEFSTGE